MKIFETDHLSDLQKEAVIKMWNHEYPEKLRHDNILSFDKYLNDITGKVHFLMLDDFEKIIGWAFIFNRNNERWFAIIIDHNMQGRQYGRLLLEKLKENETILNGWVIDSAEEIKEDGRYYISPLPFYIKQGFVLHSKERLETKVMSAVKIQWIKS